MEGHKNHEQANMHTFLVLWIIFGKVKPISVPNIGPHGPELICHFASKFLYQKC